MTLDEQPAAEPVQCPTPFSGPMNEGYAVRFIQHSPEQQAISSLHHMEVDQYLPQRLGTGYVLKYGPGKGTVFSQAQEDIMIEFYNRQAINRIRAEPKDVIKAMKDAGLEVLSANQIKSWWSAYHRKNRNLPASVPPAGISSSVRPTAVPSSVPPAFVPSNAPPAAIPLSSVPPAADPLNALPAAVPSSVPPAAAQPNALPVFKPLTINRC